MELKKGEKMIQEGDIMCMPITRQFSISQGLQYWHHGTLHLTNQRLFIEYYDQGIPFLSLFKNPKKRGVEIPLTAIKKVGGIPWRFSVSYKIGGKLQYFTFKPEQFPAYIGPGDWVNQIQRVSNVQRTDIMKALHETFSIKNIAILLAQFIILCILAIIITLILARFVSLSSGHP